MPNNCFTKYIFCTDVLSYLPIQYANSERKSKNKTLPIEDTTQTNMVQDIKQLIYKHTKMNTK